MYNDNKKDFKELLKSPFSIIIICTIIATIFIIVVFLNTKPKKQIAIDNFDDYVQDLPDDGKDQILNLLYSEATVNGDSVEIPKDGAVIREGTVTTNYDETTKIYSGNFIVDIDSLQRTYVVNYKWSPAQDIPSETSVTCPSQEDDKYGTADQCIDFTGTNKITTLMSMTPKYFNLESGHLVYVDLKHYGVTNNGDYYLEVDVNSCGDSSVIEEAKAAIHDWYVNYYISDDIVPLEIRDLCDGEG